ncbi:hypothetical protein NW733_01020 [Mycoplasmopsis felis]|nr:hypothetical protein [Mycoplasmopsis felis]MCU9931335.1 hypothetical protein [Mycoplasmopsis felis]
MKITKKNVFDYLDSESNVSIINVDNSIARILRKVGNKKRKKIKILI